GVVVDAFLFQAEVGIRDFHVTGVQTCALPIYHGPKRGTLTEARLKISRQIQIEVISILFAGVRAKKANEPGIQTLWQGQTQTRRNAKCHARLSPGIKYKKIVGEDMMTTGREPCCQGRLAGATGRGKDNQAFVDLDCRARSEEHTSELQSRENLVCRL